MAARDPAASPMRLPGQAGMRRLVTWIGRAGVCLLLITVTTDVLLRFGLGLPVPGSVEMVSYWHMVAIGFAGFVLAEQGDEHIDAPIVFDRLPAEIRVEFAVVGRVLFLLVLVAMTWWGWEEAVRQHAMGERGAAAGVPVWPARYLVPLGAAACAVEVVTRLLDEARGVRRPSAGSHPDDIPLPG